MKKIKSPVEIKKSFANGFVLSLPANEEVACQDDIALEMKRIYPFVEVSNVVEVVKEEATQEIVGKTEEKEEEVKEEIKEENQEKETKPLRRRGRSKKE
jgi:Ran GTPase-activating protein (RanGAP) involved in mRNA processing and transport